MKKEMMKMANKHGGYRKPQNPSPVSGPGKLSRRTDTGPKRNTQPVQQISGGAYGERKNLIEQQSAAPMAGTTSVPKMDPVVGLFDPTNRPEEPVTAGNVLGAGPGPSALELPNNRPSITSTIRRLAAVDQTGEAEVVLQQLSERGIV